MPIASGMRKLRTSRLGCVVLLLLTAGVANSLMWDWRALQSSQDPSFSTGDTPTMMTIVIWVLAIAPAVAVLLAALIMIGRSRRSRRAKVVRSGAAAGLVAVLLLAPVVLASTAISRNSSTPERRTFEAVAPACKGSTPIDGTQPYGGSSHPVEIVALSAKGEALLSDQLDVTLRAETFGPLADDLARVQLVACIKPDTESVVGTCTYTPSGTITRYRHYRNIAIYEAKTGQLLEAETFAGSDPPACPGTITGAGAKLEAHGDPVGSDDPRIWDLITTSVTGALTSAPTDSTAP